MRGDGFYLWFFNQKHRSDSSAFVIKKKKGKSLTNTIERLRIPSGYYIITNSDGFGNA